MNKHIELVKKWLADPKSVTQQELDDNHTATKVAYCAADYAAAYAADAAYAAAYAIDAAAADSDYAAAYAYAAYVDADSDNAAAYAYADAAKYWVRRYEELKEQGE